MTRAALKSLIMEVVDQQQRIDEFIKEFSDFDLDEAKKNYKRRIERLKTLQQHAASDLYRTDGNSDASKTFADEYTSLQELADKIVRYEETKDHIDIMVRNNKKYMLKKHSKRV